MVKAIIFDFDGVIHDTLEIAHSVVKTTDPNLSLEDYKDYFNGNVYEHRDVNSKRTEIIFDRLEKKFKELKITGGVKEELIRLGETFSLFVITSNKESILRDYFARNEVSVIKDIFGYETDESKEVKFKLLMERHGLVESDCIFVTDTLGDILEARKIGVGSIAVDFGFHERERLMKGNPLRVVSKFSEIFGVVERLG